MICGECQNFVSVDNEWYCECEVYGECTLGDVIMSLPKEQFEKFKEPK